MSGSENPVSELRPAASLTSSLLARRGTARPAMRRQTMTLNHAPLSVNDDLGWNDMGEEPVVEIEASAPTEAPTPIKEMLSVIADRITAKPARRASREPAALVETGRKAAFTLRIDSARHLRLRLLSAMTNRSAQRLLIEALDELLDRNERIKDLARQVEDNQGSDLRAQPEA